MNNVDALSSTGRFSVLILTLNEEQNLPECLAGLSFCDDIVVLDSFSSDRTVAIAEQAGVRVVQRKFDDFAGQRNFALDSIPFKYPWVFQLDADERFTPELLEECNRVVAEDRFSGFHVANKLMLNGQWLRWSGGYPTYQMRLLKVGETRFVQVGHGQREGASTRGYGTLKSPYLHYNFSKGLADWFEKHNRYSSQEATQTLAELSGENVRIADLFHGDALQRRRALKSLAHRLPCRALLKFFYLYFLRGGFLDGRGGFDYCLMQAMYEQMIVLKLRELRASRTR